jgi:hypothetical protein
MRNDGWFGVQVDDAKRFKRRHVLREMSPDSQSIEENYGWIEKRRRPTVRYRSFLRCGSSIHQSDAGASLSGGESRAQANDAAADHSDVISFFVCHTGDCPLLIRSKLSCLR